METLRPVATATATLPSGVPPPAAAAAARGYPGWVMLMPYATAEREVDDSEYSTSNSGGAKITGAASRSSSGHLVRVSLRLESPPAASGLSFHCSPCGGSGYGAHHYRPSMYVVAAHGDSVLLEMHYQKEGYQQYGIDYFFYNAGDGDEDPPRRPPSLSLSRLIRVPIPSRPGCVEVAPASSCAAAATTTTTSSWWRRSSPRSTAGATRWRAPSSSCSAPASGAPRRSRRSSTTTARARSSPTGRPTWPSPSATGCCATSTCTAASSSAATTCSTKFPRGCSTCRSPWRPPPARSTRSTSTARATTIGVVCSTLEPSSAPSTAAAPRSNSSTSPPAAAAAAWASTPPATVRAAPSSSEPGH
ncbi:Os11g0175300 [Oryza sativa Japonica Group]|uniref:Expressed protein n=2 Tax=Oryza sativa subsp. japonica TaxID=39947 RepID=Q2R9V7_ORYSJ|nr:expressed protein [Oryza sativa Japonica Group]BAG93156.1 unnamed protein product [Oryza sativa Japonica Group]BAH95111.1 Os11g0175300 [Oryza sativa Japonica Group]|eukprot:NP_001176383.1 Os11g0175300 [Oryza sativa Japonica Group]